MNFVSFDLAKKLKEKGFETKNTDWCYLDGDLVQVKIHINISPYEYAPTISQVLKWLRGEKKIHISIDIWGGTWGYDIINLQSGHSLHWNAYDENINNYEQAALAGIEYVLDNLIL